MSWVHISTANSLLHHADDTPSAVEAVEKVPLKLLPTITGFEFQVGVPVEGVSFESSDELFYQQIPSYTNSFTCFNEIDNVLFWVVLSIKLLELSITTLHVILERCNLGVPFFNDLYEHFDFFSSFVILSSLVSKLIATNDIIFGVACPHMIESPLSGYEYLVAC
ncbi:uncharacterized protein E6C27_scaffold675G00860 [Cucumis melo var. makuwa]|uniref:Uncharacterized protein n=1 Tax=Cucumis melo var. makuwa TaxID=1194695 RepID=A0A5A7U2M9_CUCMM|nr:uncharacterized protein E6C27_scaffold675G00860 [Cucumis melo var. makuwa]